VNRFAALLVGLVLGPMASAAANDLANGLGAAAGIYGYIYAHELGHAVAVRAIGGEVTGIEVPGPQCKLLCGATHATFPATTSRAQLRAINVAGFVAGNLVAEGLLRKDSAARSAFGQGFIAANVYANAAHVVKYYTLIRGRNGYKGNDIDDYELNGGNPHLLSAGLIAYSVLALHRMKQRRIPVLFVQLRL
jgi:hypothetical protein